MTIDYVLFFIGGAVAGGWVVAMIGLARADVMKRRHKLDLILSYNMGQWDEFARAEKERLDALKDDE